MLQEDDLKPTNASFRARTRRFGAKTNSRDRSRELRDESERTPRATTTFNSAMLHKSFSKKTGKRKLLVRPQVTTAKSKLNGAVLVSRAANRFKMVLKNNNQESSLNSEGSVHEQVGSFMNNAIIQEKIDESLANSQLSQSYSISARASQSIDDMNTGKKCLGGDEDSGKPYGDRKSAHNSDNNPMLSNEIKSKFSSRRSISRDENLDDELSPKKTKVTFPKFSFPGMEAQQILPQQPSEYLLNRKSSTEDCIGKPMKTSESRPELKHNGPSPGEQSNTAQELDSADVGLIEF